MLKIVAVLVEGVRSVPDVSAGDSSLWAPGRMDIQERGCVVITYKLCTSGVLVRFSISSRREGILVMIICAG